MNARNLTTEIEIFAKPPLSTFDRLKDAAKKPWRRSLGEEALAKKPWRRSLGEEALAKIRNQHF